MARESHHCMESCGHPSSPELAFSHTAVFDPHNWRGEDGLSECKWNPYWVYCKYHGWQQCPACFQEIAIVHATSCANRTLPPRKHMRLSCDDELTTVQILAFVSNLKVEQICIAASALLQHYTRVSSDMETPHSDDIAGIHDILQLMNKLAAQPPADSSLTYVLDSGLHQSIGATTTGTHRSCCIRDNEEDHHPRSLSAVCTMEGYVDG